MFETFIVNPLITILAVFYSIFGNNIVLAIIALTVLIRLGTSPLMIRQQQSTAKMQEVQPRLKEIQEKYKNDRERLAQEQLKLYQEAGINPLGGCLPLLVQFPILIALYQAIIYGLASTPYQVVDLSGRFLLPGLGDLVPLQNMWAGMDLTTAPTLNPTYALVFPVLVFATTWLQSKLTIPAPPPPSDDGKPDPSAQMTRTMTTVMPVMFAFFSLSFSVGLSIYFVVSNLVGIVQYTLMGKAKWGNLFGNAAPEAATVVQGKATPAKSNGSAAKSSPTEKKAPASPAKAPAKAASSAGGSGGDTIITNAGSKAEKRKNKKMRARNS